MLKPCHGGKSGERERTDDDGEGDSESESHRDGEGDFCSRTSLIPVILLSLALSAAGARWLLGERAKTGETHEETFMGSRSPSSSSRSPLLSPSVFVSRSSSRSSFTSPTGFPTGFLPLSSSRSPSCCPPRPTPQTPATSTTGVTARAPCVLLTPSDSRARCPPSSSSSASSTKSTLVPASPDSPSVTPSSTFTSVSTPVSLPTLPATKGAGHTEPCKKDEEAFCVNGGQCYRLPQIQKFACRCPSDFNGDRCQHFAVTKFHQSRAEYQKRAITISGICFALLATALLCCFAYRRQRRKGGAERGRVISNKEMEQGDRRRAGDRVPLTLLAGEQRSIGVKSTAFLSTPALPPRTLPALPPSLSPTSPSCSPRSFGSAASSSISPDALSPSVSQPLTQSPSHPHSSSLAHSPSPSFPFSPSLSLRPLLLPTPVLTRRGAEEETEQGVEEMLENVGQRDREKGREVWREKQDRGRGEKHGVSQETESQRQRREAWRKEQEIEWQRDNEGNWREVERERSLRNREIWNAEDKEEGRRQRWKEEDKEDGGLEISCEGRDITTTIHQRRLTNWGKLTLERWWGSARKEERKPVEKKVMEKGRGRQRVTEKYRVGKKERARDRLREVRNKQRGDERRQGERDKNFNHLKAVELERADQEAGKATESVRERSWN
uniref:uncharacterized protein isoform X2 n=1 Tax=Myxine glutinosa TaxID=7769 RepID=UPI00358E53E9